MGIREQIIGGGGEHLIVAHLNSLGYPAAIIGGCQVDVVSRIGATWRGFQVKASSQLYFSKGGTWSAEAQQKSFTEYDEADAFCFIHNGNPFPYYMAIQAVTDGVSLSGSCFTRAGRDMSFYELKRRWSSENNIELDDYATAQLGLPL